MEHQQFIMQTITSLKHVTENNFITIFNICTIYYYILPPTIYFFKIWSTLAHEYLSLPCIVCIHMPSAGFHISLI